MLNKCFIILLLFCIYNIPALADSNDFYYKSIIFDQKLIHTVTINPSKYNILNITALDVTGKNTDYLTNIAAKYGALAAINGGFFRSIENDFFVPAGPLKVANNIWHGIGYQARAAIGWFRDSNQVLIDRIKTKTSVNIGDASLAVSYFNTPYYLEKNTNYLNTKSGLYSSIYYNFFDLGNKNSHFIININQNDKLAYIYQTNNTKKLNINTAMNLSDAKVHVEIFPQLDVSNAMLWQKADYITGGAPVLIKNYHGLSNYALEKLSYNFMYHKHHRTAIGILDNDFWILVVTASGVTIPELVSIMQHLQCKDAINLDGGGSSSLYLSPKYQVVAEFSPIVNKITDAILIVPKSNINQQVSWLLR